MSGRRSIISAIGFSLLLQAQGTVVFHDTFQAGHDTAPNIAYESRQADGLVRSSCDLTTDCARADNMHRIMDRDGDGESALSLNVYKPTGGGNSTSWTSSRIAKNLSWQLTGGQYRIDLDVQFSGTGGNPEEGEPAFSVGILRSTGPAVTPQSPESIFGIRLNGTGGGFGMVANGTLAAEAFKGSPIAWNERFQMTLVVDEPNGTVQVLVKSGKKTKVKDLGTVHVDFAGNSGRFIQLFASRTDNGTGGALAVDLFDLKITRTSTLDEDDPFTLTASLSDLPETGDVILLEESAADGGERWKLAVEGSGAERNLMFEMRIDGDPDVVRLVKAKFNAKSPNTPESLLADAEAGLFRVIAPLDVIGDGPHEVILRLIPPAWDLDFFVDGVLMDEEWPLGAMVKAGAMSEPHRSVTSFRCESSASTDEQIKERSGGKEAILKKAAEFFGPDVNVPPYFRQRGFNTHAGDAAPMFDGERAHFYYLKDRDHGQNRWSLGGAYNYGHISSTDLIHWTEHPDAVPITRPYEGGIWSGSFIKVGDETLGFLHNWMLRPWFDRYNVKIGVRMARSPDGIHFDLSGDDLPIPGIFDEAGDPDIFEMEDGTYGLLGRGDRDGTRQIFFHTSPDLKNWTEEKQPFGSVPDNGDCPHCFRFDGTWYLFVSNRARKADAVRGPWSAIPASSLAVPKTLPYKNGRRLIIGTVRDGGWGGDAVFHELVRLPNGNLGEKFVPEMTPLHGEKLALNPVPFAGTVEIDGKTVAVKSDGSFAAAVIDGVPHRARIRLTVKPPAGTKPFGLVFRGAGACDSGAMLILDPAKKRAVFDRVTGAGTHVEQGLGKCLGIDGLNRPINLDVILGPDGLVDVEINGMHCVTTRASKDPDSNRLFLFSEGGEVVFENIEIRPWEPVSTMDRY
jgi:hypothetical protein